jgi:hypothetical protein
VTRVGSQTRVKPCQDYLEVALADTHEGAGEADCGDLAARDHLADGRSAYPQALGDLADQEKTVP